MNNRILDYKTQYYFEWRLAWGSAGAFGSIELLMTAHPLAGTVVLIFTILIFTTRYGFEMNPGLNYYREYLWILGFKKGKPTNFDSVDYVFLTKGKISQAMNSQISTKYVSKYVYHAYIKFNEQEKIHLLTHEDRATVVNLLQGMAKDLKCDIKDYTIPQPEPENSL
jgi:hypothetical protein